MDKMRMESTDTTAQNVDRIAALFPNCITETRDENGKLKRAVNFDLLRQMLSGDVVEGDEAYEFTWVGKKAAIVEANRPIRKTLRPCPEESVNWDTTENLYIEGDNLEVLKLLQESYLGKVKMIYIDPPYNTGNDFIYRDNFAVSQQEWSAESGEWNEDGERLFRNTDSNGRFHSDWCSMIYSRLLLAHSVLSDDGAMFISIDDHEVDNLRKMCDEVFGGLCFVGDIGWQKTYSPRNNNQGIATEIEHIIVYSKKPEWNPKRLPRTESMDSKYKTIDNDAVPWKTTDANAPGASTHQGMVYAIQNPFTGELCYPSRGRCWCREQPAMLEIMNKWANYELRDINDSYRRAEICGVDEASVRSNVKSIMLAEPLEEARLKAETLYKTGPWPIFYFTSNGKGGIARKTYLDQVQGRTPTNLWMYEEVGHTDEAKKEIKSVFNGDAPFDTPKPVRLMKRILDISTESDSLIMDFFSGSASMAHAMFKKNLEDDGNRRFIMVQIPEEISYPGFKTICDIGKERIRRAGQKILTEWEEKNTQLSIGENSTLNAPPSTLDIGFRVLKLDTTNMTDVYYSADEYDQQMLSGMESNIKSDRTDLDLLFGCLLDWGLPLSMPYTSEEIEGCTVHTYNEGDLIACFNEDIPDSVIREIAKRKPLRAVFRDSSFADSPAKINVGEIFKLLAPDTRVKVI